MMLLGLYLQIQDSLRSSDDNDDVDKEKSKEPDYDEDRDQLEEEQEDETETGEVVLTTNAVFQSLDKNQKSFYSVVELVQEEEEQDEGMTLGTRVNPE